jgi:hypothetical protein
MKLNLDAEAEEALKEIEKAEEVNEEAADFYNAYLKSGRDPLDKREIEDIIKYEKCSEEKAFYLAMLEEENLDPENEELKKLEAACRIQEMTKLDSYSFLHDLYGQTVKAKPCKKENWELSYLSYEPYQGFVFKDTEIISPYFSEKTSFGYFPVFFPYLAVMQNGKIWMSVTPHEINTMKEPLSHAHGHICVYGLGLGYFAFMAGMKKEVSSVDIIEKDPNVIALFNECLLPLFPCKDKIRIFQDDAYHYAEAKMNKDHVDYAFVDLWHQPDDGLYMYLKMKRFEKINHGTQFDYWIEDSLLILFRRALLLLISEERDGSSDEDYLKASAPLDNIVNKLHARLKETEIKTKDELLALLSADNLKKLAGLLL